MDMEYCLANIKRFYFMRYPIVLLAASTVFLVACTSKASKVESAVISATTEGWTLQSKNCNMLLAKPRTDGLTVVSGECADKGKALASILKAHPEALAAASSLLLGSISFRSSGIFDDCATQRALETNNSWQKGIEPGQALLLLSTTLASTPLDIDFLQALDIANKKVSGVSVEKVIMSKTPTSNACPGLLPDPLPEGATTWILLDSK
jgi:hypothetical protein